MTYHDILSSLFFAILFFFMILMLVRSSKVQKAAAMRTKALQDHSQKNVDAAMERSLEQLEVTKELLTETKALRIAVEKKFSDAEHR